MKFLLDMSILKDLSIGALDDAKISELAAEHNTMLTYATRCKWAGMKN